MKIAWQAQLLIAGTLIGYTLLAYRKKWPPFNQGGVFSSLLKPAPADPTNGVDTSAGQTLPVPATLGITQPSEALTQSGVSDPIPKPDPQIAQDFTRELYKQIYMPYDQYPFLYQNPAGGTADRYNAAPYLTGQDPNGLIYGARPPIQGGDVPLDSSGSPINWDQYFNNYYNGLYPPGGGYTPYDQNMYNPYDPSTFPPYNASPYSYPYPPNPNWPPYPYTLPVPVPDGTAGCTGWHTNPNNGDVVCIGQNQITRTFPFGSLSGLGGNIRNLVLGALQNAGINAPWMGGIGSGSDGGLGDIFGNGNGGWDDGSDPGSSSSGGSSNSSLCHSKYHGSCHTECSKDRNSSTCKNCLKACGSNSGAAYAFPGYYQRGQRKPKDVGYAYYARPERPIGDIRRRSINIAVS